MGITMSAKRTITNAIAARYRAESKRGKQMMLDQFCRTTGYHRKYAIQLLGSWETQRIHRIDGKPVVFVRTHTRHGPLVKHQMSSICSITSRSRSRESTVTMAGSSSRRSMNHRSRHTGDCLHRRWSLMRSKMSCAAGRRSSTSSNTSDWWTKPSHICFGFTRTRADGNIHPLVLPPQLWVRFLHEASNPPSKIFP